MSSSKRLAAVLRVRQIQERGARGSLAVERQRLRAAEAAERRTWDELDDAAGDVAARGAIAAGAGGLAGRRAVLDSGLLAATTQREATDGAERAVGSAMEVWTVAARRVEGMQRLLARVATAEEEVRQLAAANEADDLVLAKFARRLSGHTLADPTSDPLS